MSVFKRLWNSQDKEPRKTAGPAVDEIKDYQPFNPFTELLFLEQHKDIVRLLLKIDSKRCVSTADDNLAIIWDVQFGYKLVTLSGHSRPITALLHLHGNSDHGQQLLTGSTDKQIRIWDMETGDCMKILTEHLTSVKCLLSFGVTGQFCSGGEDLCLWSRDGQLQDKYKQHVDEVISDDISFLITLRNERLVTATDKQLSVYVVSSRVTEDQQRQETISLVKRMPPHREAIRSVTNVTDETFASASIDGTIILWKTDSLLVVRYFNSVQQYEGSSKTFPYSVEQIICLYNRYIMAAIGSGFALYDVETGQTLIKKENAHHSKINHMCFTCGGLYLATAAVDGSIRLWSFVDILKDIIQNNNTSGKSLVNTATTKDMLSVWWSIDNHRNTVSLVGECLAHSGAVQMLAECDGESLVSCGEDGLLIVWKNENIQMMKRSHILQTFLMCDGIV